MKESWTYAKMFARFPVALRRFLKEPLTLPRAQAIVRARMENRGDAFLRMVERGVYGQPKSPYLALMKHARCELGDLRALVHDKGVEGTLIDLAPPAATANLEGSREAGRSFAMALGFPLSQMNSTIRPAEKRSAFVPG